MTYWDTYSLADDPDMRTRCTACAATEGIPEPESWAYQRRWEYAAQPGWSDAYASAVAGNVPNPGRDPAVISDAQILTATQALNTASR